MRGGRKIGKGRGFVEITKKVQFFVIYYFRFIYFKFGILILRSYFELHVVLIDLMIVIHFG